MSRKLRVIARLDVKDENLVKGVQFEGLRKLGDPHGFALRYYEEGIDEILYLDTVACTGRLPGAPSCAWARTRLPSTRPL